MIKNIDTKLWMTHMPFWLRDRDGKEVLLYCQAESPRAGSGGISGATSGGRIWKLHYVIGDDKPKRIETGLPDSVVECSPTAWQDDTGWHVTFIAGGDELEQRYHLYRMDGQSLDQLSSPVATQRTRTGFIYNDRLAYGEMADYVHIREPAGDKDIELPGAYIYRVAYQADQPQKLLISGGWIADGEIFTLEYDLVTDEQHFIECDDKPAYKCTILDDRVIYADHTGEHFEDRKLRVASQTKKRIVRSAVMHHQLQASTQSLTQPVKRCNNCGKGNSISTNETVTRPSCLECVEKHIGAAYVLLTETRDGYAHRLRAIGHLHEAEDESQQWPELHSAIREARKIYQVDGVIPDWDVFNDLVCNIR